MHSDWLGCSAKYFTSIRFRTKTNQCSGKLLQRITESPTISLNGNPSLASNKKLQISTTVDVKKKQKKKQNYRAESQKSSDNNWDYELEEFYQQRNKLYNLHLPARPRWSSVRWNAAGTPFQWWWKEIQEPLDLIYKRWGESDSPLGSLYTTADFGRSPGKNK